jgi:chromosome segregation ATPase
MKPISVLAFLAAAVLALPVLAQDKAARMYKCVDGAGKVYYSDKMNPDCAQGSEMNRQGVVMKKKESAKPGQPAKAEVTPKTSKEQERRDRALMATYTTEEEIDAARDRSLAIPMQATNALEAKLDKYNQQLTELKKQADTLAAQKKPLPASLLADVSASQKQIAKLEADLAQRKEQSDALRAKYESDKQRFRELKAGSQVSR